MNRVTQASVGASRPGPPTGEVHVWAVREPGPGQEAALGDCLALLSPEELRRWRHMVPSQRALYASAHAALRTVTAAYTELAPHQVRFLKGRFGKPYVSGCPGLRISLAHTEGMSLVAVGRDGPTGVDVERIRPLRDPAGLRRQVLRDDEAARWPADREGPLNSGLFTHWVCKEAVLKALGSGLAGDLAAVRVHPGARRSGPVRVLAAPGSAARSWDLRLIDLGSEFRAAVAVAGGAAAVRVFPLAPGERPRLPGAEEPSARVLPSRGRRPDRAPAAPGPSAPARVPARAGARTAGAESRGPGSAAPFGPVDASRNAGAAAPSIPGDDRGDAAAASSLPGAAGVPPAPVAPASEPLTPPPRTSAPPHPPVRPIPPAAPGRATSSSGRSRARLIKESPPCSS
ncbi:4'-phosphopantetheinyl transferase superfamily protein [Streptomyces sp. NPDC002742]|uniref:4'-phosphopantetheinyl transferase family protein n=1 Tax=Streptomyces sp. NPDC002742 TaxID=3364663 RepID=UPI00368671CB